MLHFIILLPSRGGIGNMLNMPKMMFNQKPIDKKVFTIPVTGSRKYVNISIAAINRLVKGPANAIFPVISLS